MTRQKALVITALALVVIIAIQTLIIIKPEIIGRHEVTTAENAIILAKAALLQKYGEAELEKVSDNLRASIDYTYQNYWCIAERDVLDNAPSVFVRISDGKVILKWK